jgi:hypothetical protein
MILWGTSFPLPAEAVAEGGSTNPQRRHSKIFRSWAKGLSPAMAIIAIPQLEQSGRL